ncbi:hypothetical protein GCM10023346_11770 [Arthrobacter gyeryongensis]|uniref:glutaryl-CoA dehydrogenase (ETF) n=1 Tax=Arthrobacter gyeryongensis TaxID=1650592 RepID=A0ABP9S783_9MICC
MAAGEAIGCFGLTEPTAGSDRGGMTTFAHRDGGDWILNGSKRWIGLASVAKVAIIWAQTDGGFRGFVVPTETPGFTATPIEPKLSMRASIPCDIELSDLRLPESAVLPNVVGLKGPFSCLNEARYGIIWGAMGAARDAFEVALDYSEERLQFGRPLAGYQLTQQKLVDMALEINKGFLLAPRAHEGRWHFATGPDLGRQTEQLPRSHQNSAGSQDKPRRQRNHAGPLTLAACQQPGIGSHL